VETPQNRKNQFSPGGFKNNLHADGFRKLSAKHKAGGVRVCGLIKTEAKKKAVLQTASKNKLKFTMSNLNLPNFQFKSNADGDRSRRELLEQSKLSRRPELPDRRQFELPDIAPTLASAVCVNCGGRLDADDNIQQSVKVCRKCLAHYAVIDAAIDEASRRKRREMLERFAGGAK